MSFIEVLRKARLSPAATLHKFITNYDPASQRVYAFVEGEPDRVYFRHHITAALQDNAQVFVYNCEGKARVFNAFRDVVSRYPDCRRVLFFVDKDLDDFVGVAWPSNPRIFVTETYSVEAYVIGRDACRAYFRDHVKLRRLDIDVEHCVAECESARVQFHRMMIAIMGWIIAFRRRGGELRLKDIQLDKLFRFDGTRLKRVQKRAAHTYLSGLRSNGVSSPTWREVVAIVRRLRAIDSKAYIRGHFDAWCFVNTMRRIGDDLQKVAAETDGSVSFYTQLSENNYIQLLCTAVDCPQSLKEFLCFHLAEPKNALRPKRRRNWWRLGLGSN